ncbi:HET-domain-containing protein [Xylariaceae sp. FL0804]|nr:HET-domain-containing protein [Xylariaceae sp. FL0804]
MPELLMQDQHEASALERPTDTRLVTILPGKGDEPVRIAITHVPFDVPAPAEPKHPPLKEIQMTLPEGWRAYETLEGRVIFHHIPEDITTWDHPDPSIDRELYDLAASVNQETPAPDYEALSYCWGSKRKRRTVLVVSPGTADTAATAGPATASPSAGTRRLKITSNLAVALRYLRNSDRPRRMWIDAICIDQSRDQERNHQVQRMGTIYARARRVVVWLGPGFPGSGATLSILDHIGRQIESTRDNYFGPSPGCEHPHWFGGKVRLPYDDDDWDAIRRLLGSAWFTRLWVVQEIQLASNESVFKCGNDEISWYLFRRALILIYNNDSVIPELEEQMSRQRSDMFAMNFRDTTFNELLIELHTRECRESNDKVYGLRNLAPPEIAKHIIVDYKQSHRETYMQTFLACLKHEKRLAQLPLAGRRHGTSATAGWPSWLPDWNLPFLGRTCPRYLGFCASGVSGVSGAGARDLSSGRLEVTGRRFASISSANQQLQDWASVAEALKELGIEQLRAATYPAGGTLLDAWLQSITQARTVDRYPKFEHMYPCLADLRKEVLETIHSLMGDRSLIPDAYRRVIATWVRDRWLFTTDNGYVGMIDGHPQPGDLIFVMLGCDIPMLLRPSPSGEYGVVGDCYVHGIMDGEALLGSFSAQWSVQYLGDGTDQYDRPCYCNSNTGLKTTEDPRLESVPLPPVWEPVEWERTRADPIFCNKYRHKDTGEIINSDPRLFPEALRERGVELTTVTLV